MLNRPRWLRPEHPRFSFGPVGLRQPGGSMQRRSQLSNRQPRWRAAVGAAAITGVLFAGVLAGVRAADPVIMRIGIGEQPSATGLNPFLALLATDYELIVDRYDLLIEFGPNLEPAAGLAQSWDVTDNGTTWTYHMRPNVTWQDGQPFTAEDARFTLGYIFDSHDPKYKGPAAPTGNDLLDGNGKPNPDGEADNPLTLFDSYVDLDNGLDQSRITSIEAPDATTLVIKTKVPIITLGQMYVPILPEHIWKDITFAKAATDNITLDESIGSGPFRVTEFTPSQAVILQPYAGYWGGAPHIDQLVYQYFDNDEAQINALKSGDVDLLDNFPPGFISNLQNDANIKLNIGKSSDFGELGFNGWNPTPKRFNKEGCSDCPKGPTTGSLGNPWLTRPEVRAGLAGLLDKKALIQQAYGGLADPGISIVSPLNPLYAYAPPAGDPITFPDYTDEASQQAATKAAQDRFTTVMTGLGFADTDGNGILNVPDTADARQFDPDGAGKDWKLRLYVRNDNQKDKLAAELMLTWFETAGVKIDYQQISTDKLTHRTYPSDTNADTDMYIWGWGPDPDPNFILSIFACNQIDGWSDSNYCDPAYDKLYLDQRTQSDLNARADIVKNMQDKVYHDSPYAVLWYSNTLQAYRADRWQGFTPVPSKQGDIWSSFGFGPYGSRVNVAPLGTAPNPSASAQPSAGESGPPASGVTPTIAPSSGQGAGATSGASAAPAATLAPGPTPAASAGSGATGGGGGSEMMLVLAGAAVAAVVVGGVWYRRRSRDSDDDD
jgi:peptide/nickel transport system substrate-binding protein